MLKPSGPNLRLSRSVPWNMHNANKRYLKAGIFSSSRLRCSSNSITWVRYARSMFALIWLINSEKVLSSFYYNRIWLFIYFFFDSISIYLPLLLEVARQLSYCSFAICSQGNEDRVMRSTRDGNRGALYRGITRRREFPIAASSSEPSDNSVFNRCEWKFSKNFS